MFTYLFEKPQEYSPRMYQRLGQYVCDAQAIFDVLQQSPEKSLPLITPLPDKIITFHFDNPLPDSVLERLAKEGYRYINPPEYVSDRAAE